MRLLFILLVGVSLVFAATYYVAKTGDDGNVGSEAEPWLTISHAVPLVVAGDSVWVKAGTYDESLWVRGCKAGTAAAPIVFKSYDGWSTIINGWVQLDSAYYYLEDFKVSPDSNGIVQVIKINGDSCIIRGCEITPVVPNGYWAGGILTTSDGNLIDGNTIHHNGDSAKVHGIYSSHKNQTITNNVIYGQYVHGIQAYPAIESSEIAYNIIYGNGGAGIVLEGRTTRVHGNVIYDNAQVGASAGIQSYGAIGCDIYNNVCDGPLLLSVGGAESLSIRNNIFTGGMNSYTNVLTTLTMNYNCWYPGGVPGGWTFQWFGGGHGNFAQFQAATGQETNGFTADPLFVDTATHNFRLTLGSPCIDAGDPATPNTLDMDGNYYMGLPDMGAYWYDGGPILPDTVRIILKSLLWGGE